MHVKYYKMLNDDESENDLRRCYKLDLTDMTIDIFLLTGQLDQV